MKCALAACLLLAAALGTTGRVVATAPRPHVPAEPDARGRASAEFETLFDTYRNGDAEGAVERFSRWEGDRVAEEARLPDGDDSAHALAALALFHTEAGMRNLTFGRYRDDTGMELHLGFWGLEDVFEPHSYRAYQLIQQLIGIAKARGDRNLLQFCKSWYIVSISYCMRWGYDCGEQLVERGEHEFDGEDDAEYLLLLGSRRSGGLRHQEPGDVMVRDMQLADMQYARWAFQKALKKNPDLVEARMRFGRLLHFANEQIDAARELERALADARASNHLFAEHMAAFTLGELHEEADEMDEAIRYYRIAFDLYPRGHTAAIALGQALVRSGHGPEGWAIARDMFAGEGPGAAAALDPFAVYRFAQYWQSGSRVKAMREVVRR
jgi:tetratricopeptide (TPR) repeat protein